MEPTRLSPEGSPGLAAGGDKKRGRECPQGLRKVPYPPVPHLDLSTNSLLPGEVGLGEGLGRVLRGGMPLSRNHFTGIFLWIPKSIG